MTRSTHRYQDKGDTFDAVVTHPNSPGPHPAVLICHAWSGRQNFEEEKAEKMAALGYVGAAIDVYGIGQRGTDLNSNNALMRPLLNEPTRLRSRLEAALECVRNIEGVDPHRIAVMGYCFGGLCALLMARMGLPLRAAVSFHGLLKTEPLEAQPKAKILVLHGQDDPMVPPSDVGAFAEEMKRINADWQLHAYAGVMHAFTNPAANNPAFGTRYDAEADQRSWTAMTRFFTDHL